MTSSSRGSESRTRIFGEAVLRAIKISVLARHQPRAHANSHHIHHPSPSPLAVSFCLPQFCPLLCSFAWCCVSSGYAGTPQPSPPTEPTSNTQKRCLLSQQGVKGLLVENSFLCLLFRFFAVIFSLSTIACQRKRPRCIIQRFVVRGRQQAHSDETQDGRETMAPKAKKSSTTADSSSSSGGDKSAKCGERDGRFANFCRVSFDDKAHIIKQENGSLWILVLTTPRLVAS